MTGWARRAGHHASARTARSRCINAARRLLAPAPPRTLRRRALGRRLYDAVAYCSRIGASIATIYSATENELARQACGGSTCWIGLEEVGGSASTPKASQTWRWMDGSTASYTNWLPSEPQNHEGNDERNAIMNCCGTDGVDASGMWYDAPDDYDEPKPLCRTDDCSPSSGGCDPIYNFAGATRTCTSSNYPENCIVVVENSQHADCNAWCAAAGSWCINGWDSHGGSCDNIDQTDDTWPQGCGGDNLFHDGICMCAPVGGTSSQTDGGPCTPQRADDLDDDGPDAASAATIIACVAAAMCAVLIGVVGFLYWKMQQVQGRPVGPVGQAIAVEMATYGQTMAAPSYVLKAASAPPAGAFASTAVRQSRAGSAARAGGISPRRLSPRRRHPLWRRRRTFSGGSQWTILKARRTAFRRDHQRRRTRAAGRRSTRPAGVRDTRLRDTRSVVPGSACRGTCRIRRAGVALSKKVRSRRRIARSPPSPRQMVLPASAYSMPFLINLPRGAQHRGTSSS